LAVANTTTLFAHSRDSYATAHNPNTGNTNEGDCRLNCA